MPFHVCQQLPCFWNVLWLILWCYRISKSVMISVKAFSSGHLELSLTKLERWMQLPNPPWISETYWWRASLFYPAWLILWSYWIWGHFPRMIDIDSKNYICALWFEAKLVYLIHFLRKQSIVKCSDSQWGWPFRLVSRTFVVASESLV